MTRPPRFSEWRPHPWHGLEIGDDAPRIVNAYIEITPFDVIKYEIDKASGYLRVDRPQRTSSQAPALYGFVPRTYCGEKVAALTVPGGPRVVRGDGDPLDICVLSDRPINRGDILLEARPIGGLRMVEAEEADDKIVAVLLNDPSYGGFTELSQLPRAVIDRLRHYFLTYKTIPGEQRQTITVDPLYDRAFAHRVLEAAAHDYRRHLAELTQ